jgi:hypothetical protein
MSRTLPTACVVFHVVIPLLLGACASQESKNGDVAQKLQAIAIDANQLSGSPRKIIKQLNKLSKASNAQSGGGVNIVFDRAVDPDNCTMTIFRSGEPLAKWLQTVCRSCGATYQIRGNKVVIELLPISDKQTVDLAAILPEGMAEACFEFRSKQRGNRLELGEKLLELLPKSRVTWSEEVPMHQFVSHDYESPSYKLYKKDVLILLGDPDKNVNNQIFRYSLEPHGKATLSVNFDEYEYVVDHILIY